MPTLVLPDGVELHYEQLGEGSLVVLVGLFYSPPARLAGLAQELARDHRVVTYDVRGTGGSSPRGPYDMATDVGDLIALLEQTGGPVVLVGTGDGCNRAVHAAVQRREMIAAVVHAGNAPLGRAPGVRDGLAGSGAVLNGLVTMLENDYRAALRNMFTSAGAAAVPEGDERIRELVDDTVAYCPREPAVARMRAWIDDQALRDGAALGDTLWLLHYDDGNRWFRPSGIEGMRELLPEAHFASVENGPIARPDLTAAFVRSITAGPGL